MKPQNSRGDRLEIHRHSNGRKTALRGRPSTVKGEHMKVVALKAAEIMFRVSTAEWKDDMSEWLDWAVEWYAPRGIHSWKRSQTQKENKGLGRGTSSSRSLRSNNLRGEGHSTPAANVNASRNDPEEFESEPDVQVASREIPEEIEGILRQRLVEDFDDPGNEVHSESQASPVGLHTPLEGRVQLRRHQIHNSTPSEIFSP
ncbi:uncharacterized protein PAC_04167 [Phialocephala subalpina]|uniref:Uncharacterized protein n=1 Tax=Phialocephala subalpina TaxID=576137 RepID=A0A1L7WND9_9HELO|nr:uncharacterized protein PAC_04167 [Phialocephala subalpina]